jgi:hypothetical protein
MITTDVESGKELPKAEELLRRALLAHEFGWEDPHLGFTKREWETAAENFLRRKEL